MMMMNRQHNEAIMNTIRMTGDARSQLLAAERGLKILDLTWEDTARIKGSVAGPNISDLTLQVLDASGRPRCMPVIRHPNFADKSGDLPMFSFGLLVGNERGLPLRRITLAEYLEDLRAHLHRPGSWRGDRTSLLAPQRKDNDVHALVSAQACMLPIPEEGKVQFSPVLFNYQSRAGDPAVLAIVVSREGTSATIIDNKRDGFQTFGGSWGQRLFFNQNGERCSFTGTRLADFKAAGGDATTSASAASQAGINMVLLVQVPLKQKAPSRGGDLFAAMSFRAAESLTRGGVSRGIEDAVIGHGTAEGAFTEIADLDIERDDRFPVRVTVQFYKGTTDGIITAADMDQIAAQIARVYDDSKYVGSLVTETNTRRSTEWDPEGAAKEPAGFWEDFWKKHLQETGKTPDQVKAELTTLLGKDPSVAIRDEIIGAIGRLAT